MATTGAAPAIEEKDATVGWVVGGLVVVVLIVVVAVACAYGLKRTTAKHGAYVSDEQYTKKDMVALLAGHNTVLTLAEANSSYNLSSLDTTVSFWVSSNCGKSGTPGLVKMHNGALVCVRDKDMTAVADPAFSYLSSVLSPTPEPAPTPTPVGPIPNKYISVSSKKISAGNLSNEMNTYATLSDLNTTPFDGSLPSGATEFWVKPDSSCPAAMAPAAVVSLGSDGKWVCVSEGSESESNYSLYLNTSPNPKVRALSAVHHPLEMHVMDFPDVSRLTALQDADEAIEQDEHESQAMLARVMPDRRHNRAPQLQHKFFDIDNTL